MSESGFLSPNQIYEGDARQLLQNVAPDSVALSFWSPPYFVGKSYESEMDYEAWSNLLRETIEKHHLAITPGGFLAINIADILAFEDPEMPRIQADNISSKKVKITREQVLAAQRANPEFDKYQLAALLGCSEQTIDRRLKHNNVRGGKYAPQTRVKLTAGLVEEWATNAGFYLYDRRVWVKDPSWENSRWHSLSYRSVDEWEHLLIFWKPGITVVNRNRLDAGEWAEWGSRSVWRIASVRSNNVHESQFPVELPRRMIRLLTEPGDLVLDCFVGSGTTALAAIQEGRQFMGFDINPNSVRLAESRIEQTLATTRMLL
jgi:site-specific DNA-methyltransferase (adenine-specific)